MIRTTGKTDYVTITPQELADAVQNYLMLHGKYAPHTIAQPLLFTPTGGLTVQISPVTVTPPPSEKIIPFQPHL